MVYDNLKNWNLLNERILIWIVGIAIIENSLKKLLVLGSFILKFIFNYI